MLAILVLPELKNISPIIVLKKFLFTKDSITEVMPKKLKT